MSLDDHMEKMRLGRIEAHAARIATECEERGIQLGEEFSETATQLQHNDVLRRNARGERIDNIASAVRLAEYVVRVIINQPTDTSPEGEL